MNLSEVFLGIIALSVLAMAAGQVAAVVMAARAVRRIGEGMSRLEQDLRPIVANVHAVSADAARAAASAATQVERAERLVNDAARRIDETMSTVQDIILAPARDGMAIMRGVRAAFRAFFTRPASGRSHPSPAGSPVPRAVPDPGDDDHASFIG